MSEIGELRQEVEQLRVAVAQLDATDDWAGSVFLALQDTLQLLLQRDPALAAALGGQWRALAARYDRALANPEHAESVDETPAMMEARKILFRWFDAAGLWPRAAT